jgi:hypothetical protein
LSQRQTLERLRHGDPGCGDDRRHEDFDFADADEVDAIAAKMTSLSVGDSSLTSLERTWPRRRSPWRSPATRLTERRFRDVERSPRRSPSRRQRRPLLHGDTQHHPARCRSECEGLIAPDVIPPTVACGGVVSRLLDVCLMCAWMCCGALLAGACSATASYSQEVTAPA